MGGWGWGGREKFIDKQIDDRRSVSTTPLQGDTAAGHSWPSIGGKYYTSTLRSALWNAFQQHTRGTKPLPVRLLFRETFH